MCFTLKNYSINNLIKNIISYFSNYNDCFSPDSGIKRYERDFIENYIVEMFSNQDVQWVAGKLGRYGSYSLRSNFVHIRKGYNDKYCTVRVEGEYTLEFIGSFIFFKKFKKFREAIRVLEINQLMEVRYSENRIKFQNSKVFQKAFLYEIIKTR